MSEEDPSASYQWSCPNRDCTSNIDVSRIKDGNSVSVNVLGRNDEGQYSCTVSGVTATYSMSVTGRYSAHTYPCLVANINSQVQTSVNLYNMDTILCPIVLYLLHVVMYRMFIVVYLYTCTIRTPFWVYILNRLTEYLMFNEPAQ